MNRFFKLIPKIIKNRKKIVEGFLNDIKMDKGHLSKEEQEVILERRLICEYCEDNSKTAFPYCKLCGCDIKIKTACFTTCCGAAEYNKLVDESHQKEVKWHEYEKEESGKGDN
jgi:hypothetical protein